ncbi:MAG: acyltransferase family protein [Anaerolineales bacterium]
MTNEGNRPAEKSTVQATTGDTSRLFFADHLRAALVILVVLHHVAAVYAANVPWFYYIDPQYENLLAMLVLMAFMLLNQAWFMGAFYLLAGHFTPGSYDRKGSGSFLKDRLIRLGIPLIMFSFLLGPFSSIGLYLEPAPRITDPLTWDNFWQLYPELISMGPLWFVALLLIFSFGYVAWRILTRNRKSSSVSEYPPPSHLGIGVFILGLTLVSYLVRIFIPIGREVFEFPTLAYLPQYLSLLIVGVIAYRRNWFRTIPGSMGVVGFVIAMVATITLFTFVYIGFLRAIETGVQQIPQFGYGTWRSALYALWDSIFAVGMSLAAITFFRRFFNKESRFGSFLAQQSYAVYIIHIPIMVILTYAMHGLGLGGLLKFGVASLIVVPICFVVAFLLRKIPGMSRVI